MSAFGYPEVYGHTRSGHCGHCWAADNVAQYSRWGIFCGACFRWRTYTGPKQEFGDGMKVTKHRVVKVPIDLEG